MDKISLYNIKLNLKLFYGQFEVDYNVLKYSVAFIRPAFACNKNTENNDKYCGMVVQWLVLSQKGCGFEPASQCGPFCVEFASMYGLFLWVFQ